jgi:hypothetical protein
VRESCSCGADIAALSYRRVKEWRQSHQHETGDEEGPQGTTSQVELAPEHVEPGGEYEWQDRRIGFRPNR